MPIPIEASLLRTLSSLFQHLSMIFPHLLMMSSDQQAFHNIQAYFLQTETLTATRCTMTMIFNIHSS